VFVVSDFSQNLNTCHENSFSSSPVDTDNWSDKTTVRGAHFTIILMRPKSCKRVFRYFIVSSGTVPDVTAAVGRCSGAVTKIAVKQEEQLACDHLQLTAVSPVRSVVTRYKESDT